METLAVDRWPLEIMKAAKNIQKFPIFGGAADVCDSWGPVERFDE